MSGTAANPTLFEALGEERLRRIVDDFIDRAFDDVMIGFLFRNASRERLKEMEYQFAARHLGAENRYEGKPIQAAHAPHRILSGQFNRRRELLRRTLVDHDAPPEVVDHWLRHTESLRAQVIVDADGSCSAPPSEARDR